MSSNLWASVDELGEYADSDYAYDAVKTASYILWALSGRKFSGITTTTERYVSVYDPFIRTGASTLSYWPELVEGNVVNTPISGVGRYYENDYLADGTSSNSRVRLRGRKVVRVHTVRDINGNIIDPKSYYLADHSTLIATPGANWSSPNVEVTYTYGTPPPNAGRAAARMLATELIKLYEGDDECALPQRVTSISRQGVSYTILDNQDFIDSLRTGVYAVDLFLKSANPDGARARARVFSPDIPRARRITGKEPAFELSVLDLYVDSNGGATLVYLDDINADFLLNDTSWQLSVTMSDWDSSKTETLSDAIDLDRTAGTITVSSSYNDVLSVIGPRDPGTLDVYATRPSPSNPSIDEVINLFTSNVIMQLGERVKPIYIA